LTIEKHRQQFIPVGEAKWGLSLQRVLSGLTCLDFREKNSCTTGKNKPEVK
jgi:hypothetical protein